MDTDAVKQAQARVTRLQAALDDLLTGKLRSGLEASTGAGSQRVGYFRPEPDLLRADLARAHADLARLQGDRRGMREAFLL